MQQLTPHLAKLITLKLMKASLQKLQGNGVWSAGESTLSPQEQQLMREAVDDQLKVLDSNIIYQERLCK